MTASGVREFLEGKTIFLTGGSGFMGKVLVEKFLHSCSDLKEIFLLIRPKRGQNGQERFKEFFNSPVFHRVKDRPELLSKITPIYGDITKENLGLSDENFELVTSSTNIVFHLAAFLKMDAPLKLSVEGNLAATKNVLDLCKKMKNLLVVLHLSTAFCNCDQEISEEKVYDWPLDPKDLIKCAELMSEEKIMKNFPNSYTFTKRMAEILVRDEFEASDLNLCIVRPSIVMPAWMEPTPGWVDSLNGFVGAFAAFGKGILRTMMCEGSFHAQIIPVDQAIAAMIAIASNVGSRNERPSKIPVFNVNRTDQKPITYGTMFAKIKRIGKIFPIEPGLWYPDGDLTTNHFKHYFLMIFTMWLPALFVEGLLLITFQTPFMIRVQKKLFGSLSVFEYFLTREWIFKSKNFEEILKNLSEDEKKIFKMNTEEVDDDEYFTSFLLGVRQFCLKESPETIPRSRIFLKMQLVADLLLKAFLIYIFGIWFLRLIKFSEFLTQTISIATATFVVAAILIERIRQRPQISEESSKFKIDTYKLNILNHYSKVSS